MTSEETICAATTLKSTYSVLTNRLDVHFFFPVKTMRLLLNELANSMLHNVLSQTNGFCLYDFNPNEPAQEQGPEH